MNHDDTTKPDPTVPRTEDDWLELADTQWRQGCLQPEIRQRALEILEGRTGIRGPLPVGKPYTRDRSLQIRLYLRRPPRPREPEYFLDHNTWEVGEVVSFQLGSGQLILVRVLGTFTDRDGEKEGWSKPGETSPLIEILDWAGSRVPPIEEIHRLPIRKALGPLRYERAVLFRNAAETLRSPRFRATGLRFERAWGFALARRQLTLLIYRLQFGSLRRERPYRTCLPLFAESFESDLREYYGWPTANEGSEAPSPES